MRTVTMMMLLCMFVVGGWIGAPNSSASDSRSQCLADAQNTFLDCKALCQENLQADKDECRNISHECAEACRGPRETCVDAALDKLDACFTPCQDTFLTARANCVQLYSSGSKSLDRCIDAAQITAFICRDDCRESVELAAALKECNKAFRICMRACKSPSLK